MERTKRERNEMNFPTSPAKGTTHTHAEGVTEKDCQICKEEEANFEVLQRRLRDLSAINREQRARVKAETLQNMPAMNPIVNPEQFHAEAEAAGKNFPLGRVAAGAAGFVLVGALLLQLTHPTSTVKVAEGYYRTADEGVQVELSKGDVKVSGAKIKTKFSAAKTWSGNWRDELDLITGQYDSSLWLKTAPEGLKTESGLTLYSSSAPELRVIKQMKLAQKEAADYYAAHQVYPNTTGVLSDYMNSVSKRAESPTITPYVGANLISANGKTKFELDLLRGKNTGAEIKAAPGQINCINVQAEPLIAADLNSYGWKTNAFFVRGYDRNGNPICSADGNDAMTFAMKNGLAEGIKADNSSEEAVQQPQSVCFFNGERPDKQSIFIRYGIFAFIVFGLFAVQFLAMMHKKLTDVSDVIGAGDLDSATVSRLRKASQKQTVSPSLP